MKLRIVASETEHSYQNSCTAGVLQSLYHFYTGRRLTIRKAVKKMNCEKDGATFHAYPKILGMKRKFLRSSNGIKRTIREGYPVVASEYILHGEAHAILITGYTPKGFYFMDPALGNFRWRSEAWINKNAFEFQCLVGEPQIGFWQRCLDFFG